MKTRTPGVFAVLAIFTFLNAASGQSAKVLADMEFVRGLVTELRFIDLAQFEVENLKKVHKDSDDFKMIAQLAIEVSLQGAKRHPDRGTRIALYREAIDKSQEFIERYSTEKVAADARITLAEACIEFGFFLNEELEIARDEDPSKVPDLEEKAAAVFRQGVEVCDKTRKAFLDAGDELQANIAWMRKAILLREHGRAVKKDRGYLCDQAMEVFEELILEVGEETILGQKGLLEAAKINEVKGDLESAVSSYRSTVNAIYVALSDENVVLPEAAQRIMFDMMQEVYDRLATVSVTSGQTERVDKIVEEYDKRLKEFNATPDPRFYDSVMLTQAKVNANSSKQTEVSKALKVAKSINKSHPNDYVGLKAKNLIRDILRTSSDLVTGELLLEVAIGDYQAKSYDAAIAGFKRALNGMDSEAKAKHGFDTWVYIARCNDQMQRHLEAAMAYSAALEKFGEETQAKDEDLAKRTSQAATRAMAKAFKSAGDSPLLAETKNKVDELRKQFDQASAEAGDYIQGLRAKSAGKFADAVASFDRVSPDYPRYELALGHAAECLFRLGKMDETRAKIKQLRDHAKNTELDENDTQRRGFRPQALAWVHYTEGRILYEQASGATTGTPDLTKFKDVEKHFLEFETLHGANSSAQMPKVHEVLGHAYLEMGDEAKATERYSKLKTLGESRPDAHKALGALMFETYLSRVKALAKEANAKPDAKTQAQLKETRKKAMELGLDYSRTVGKPQYGILYNTMRLAEDLRAWPRVEWAAEKILKIYGEKNYSSLRQVKPLLGYAMLRQPGRMQEALVVLKEAEKELEPKPGKRKSSGYYEVQRYQALALGGWPDFDKDGINYEPNPGLGKPAEAYDIYWFDKDFRKYMLHSQRAPAYSLAWYQYHLEAYYFARAAERTDKGKFAQRAQTLYNIARSTDDFATLKALGEEGVRIANLFAFVK